MGSIGADRGTMMMTSIDFIEMTDDDCKQLLLLTGWAPGYT